MVVLTDSEPGKKWWEGFILNRDGVEVAESCLDSRKRIVLKLLPSAALQLEEAAAASAAEEPCVPAAAAERLMSQPSRQRTSELALNNLLSARPARSLHGR